MGNIKLDQQMTSPVICITGATGFIGSHLVPLLKQQGANLRVLKRTGTPSIEDGVEIHIGDLFDQPSLLHFLTGAQFLINLAQPSGSIPDEQFAEGMNNLAHAARQMGILRLLHVSTAMVIGIPDGDQVDEASVCRPVTSYERQKLNAEIILQSELVHGVDLGILRPTAVFGIGSKNLVKLMDIIDRSTFLYRIVLRTFHGNRHMHLVSVEDVVAAIIFLIFHPQPLSGNVFLLSADDESTNNYQTVDSILGNSIGKPMPKQSLSIPKSFLQLFLRLAGRSQANPQLVYKSNKLHSWGFRRMMNFDDELRKFARDYVQGKCQS